MFHLEQRSVSSLVVAELPLLIHQVCLLEFSLAVELPMPIHQVCLSVAVLLLVVSEKMA
jgi:hypothetical protein